MSRRGIRTLYLEILRMMVLLIPPKDFEEDLLDRILTHLMHYFIDPATKQKASVEGHLTRYNYSVKKEMRGWKSMLQIARNYANAINKIGGKSFIESPNGRGNTWMKATGDGKEIWASIEQDNWQGNSYYLFIVEKEAMEQDVVADARFMAEGLGATGHVAL